MYFSLQDESLPAMYVFLGILYIYFYMRSFKGLMELGAFLVAVHFDKS